MQFSIPGLSINVSYDREEMALAAADKVADLAHRGTYAFVNKGLGDTERVAQTSLEAGAVARNEAAKAAKTAKESLTRTKNEIEVIAHLTAKATVKKVGAKAKTATAPLVDAVAAMDARRVVSHEKIRARLLAYSAETPMEAQLESKLLLVASHEAKPAAPRKRGQSERAKAKVKVKAVVADSVDSSYEFVE